MVSRYVRPAIARIVAARRRCALSPDAFPPLIRFIALGGVLLALHTVTSRPNPSPDAEAALLYRTGIGLGFDRQSALVRQRLEDVGQFLELDATAARAAGLEDTDPIIRRHIAHLAELALRRGGSAVLPTEAEVADYYAAHPERFREPPRVRLTQMYFSLDRRGRDAEPDARAAVQRLRRAPHDPAEIAGWGDPFPGAWPRTTTTRGELERAFGPHFAAAVDAMPIGAWSGPLSSTYGFHAVLVEHRIPATRQPLAAVRSQIVHELARERSARLAARRLARLRPTAARHTP